MPTPPMPMLMASRAGGFDFTSIPDCSLLLDPDIAASLTFSAGTLVSQWDDLSGNGRHVTQAVQSDQPSASGSQNGRVTMIFDGVGDKMSRASAPINNATTGLWTVFAAVKHTGALNGTRGIVDHDQDATRVAQFIRTINGQSQTIGFPGAPSDSATSLVLDTWAVVHSRRTTSELEVFVNGSGDGPNAVGSGNTYSATATLMIARANGEATTWLGEIGLIVCYARPLSDGESTDVVGAMMDLMGI